MSRENRTERPRRRRGEVSPQHRRPSRLAVVATVIVLAALVGGAVAVAYYSPLMSVRSVKVVGTTVVDRAEVLRLAQVQQGRPLLQVDTAAIANRVAALDEVESVRVERSYPSTLTIDVTERVPVATLDWSGKIGVMDRLGKVYATFADRQALPKEFAALPIIEVERPGPTDPTTQAVLTVAQALPDWLRKRTTSMQASSPSDITLVLGSGRRAVWGDAERNEEKAQALRSVLTVKGSSYNVSSPDFPAVS